MGYVGGGGVTRLMFLLDVSLVVTFKRIMNDEYIC